MTIETDPTEPQWYQTMDAYLRANVICYGLDRFINEYPAWVLSKDDVACRDIATTINKIRFEGMSEVDVVTITAGLTKFVKHILIGKKGIYPAITYPFSTDKLLFDAAQLCDAVSFDSEIWWDFKENFIASISDNMDDCANSIFTKDASWEKNSEDFARKSADYFIRMMMSLEFGNFTWHYNLQDAIDCFAWYLVAPEWLDSTQSSLTELNHMKWAKRQEIVQILANYISKKNKK